MVVQSERSTWHWMQRKKYGNTLITSLRKSSVWKRPQKTLKKPSRRGRNPSTRSKEESIISNGATIIRRVSLKPRERLSMTSSKADGQEMPLRKRNRPSRICVRNWYPQSSVLKTASGSWEANSSNMQISSIRLIIFIGKHSSQAWMC